MIEPSPLAAISSAIRESRGDGNVLPVSICVACVASMPIDGASLSLIDKDSRPERVGASDQETQRLEEVQATLGEGPVFDAIESGAPVLVSDFGPTQSGRWPAFAETIAGSEVSAIFVLPLQVGAARLGTLSLYRHSGGPLPSTVLSEALRVTDLIGMMFVGRKGGLTTDFVEQWLDESSWTREVHQATGMVASQLEVGAEEAFVRFRAYAFANDMSLTDLARAIVSRRVRLDEAP